MKEVGKRWKSLTKEEKKIFEDKAKEDKKRYDKEMEAFNSSLNKINISTTDDKKKTKGVTKKSKVQKGKGKLKNKKRQRRSSEAQAEYYYPGKTHDNKQQEIEKPKNDYSLRRRNRDTKKYIDLESDDNEGESSDSENQYGESNSKNEEDKNSAPNSMPKKPLSSYIFFSQKVRDEIKKEKPYLTVPELMKEISSRWQTINEEDKMPYNKMAKRDRTRYENELNVYKQKSKTSHHEPIENEPLQRSRSNNEFSGRIAKTSPDNDMPPSRSEIRIAQPPIRQTSATVAPITVVPGSPTQSRVRSKKERRSKKNFDYPYRPMPDSEYMISPPNNDFLGERPSFSNFRMAMNEDRATERSRPDSIQMAFNEDKEKEPFLNKDSPPDNEYIDTFGRNPGEQEPDYGDNMMFGPGGGNDSFYQPSTSFRGDPLYFNEPNYNRNFAQPFGNGYSGQMDFKFGPPNPVSGRTHQNSFNNPFADQPRGQSFGPDYLTNVMNPSNMPYSGSMNSQNQFNRYRFNNRPGGNNNNNQ